MPDQQQAAFDDGIQIVLLRIDGCLAREGQQVFDDAAAAPAFALDDLQIAFGVGQALLSLKPLSAMREISLL